jgi:hypothetical protein
MEARIDDTGWILPCVAGKRSRSSGNIHRAIPNEDVDEPADCAEVRVLDGQSVWRWSSQGLEHQQHAADQT